MNWDRLSEHYDRQLWLEHAAVRDALDLLDARRDERLLDVGTGTGEVLRELARRPLRPAAATGIDASRAMLARVPDLPPGWTVLEGDARRLPFDDGAFDVAVASYLLHLLPAGDVDAVLSELRRVLRPGGRLVTVTPTIPPGRGEGGGRAARRLALAADARARRDPDRHGGMRAFDPREALQRAGFSLVDARTSVRGYASLSVLAAAGQA